MATFDHLQGHDPTGEEEAHGEPKDKDDPKDAHKDKSAA